MFSPRPHNHRTSISILLALFLFVQSTLFLFYPKPAHAQLATAVISSVPAVISSFREEFGKMALAAGMSALVQGVSYFMRKMAYDAANYVAAGGKGQGALVFQDGYDKYLERTAADAGATAIEALGKPFGLNICQPPDVGVQLTIQIGLKRLYDPGNGPKPSCSWSALKKRFDGPNADNFNVDEIGDLFGGSLKVTDTDIGIALGAIAEVDRITAQKKFAADKARLEGAGFKPVTDLITGNIKTPAQTTKRTAELADPKFLAEQNYQQIAGLYAADLAQVFPMAASVFLNTVTSKLLDTAMRKGLFPDDKKGDAQFAVTDFYASVIQDNRKAAEQAFSFLQTTIPARLQDFDVINTYAACPTNPGLNNCVINEDFRNALEQGRLGDPLTIQEAMDKGYLNANASLISPRREADIANIQKCWQDWYCYPNIQKLRKVRIVPLGFEIAALRSDPDNPWTLKQVVDGFNDCKIQNGAVVPDPAKPFCRLIDPNWLITVPESRCEALVHGPELETAQSPERRRECADISTKIASLSEETTESSAFFGYCTKEKNVWEMPGDSCPAQYATCTGYQDATGKQLSYLARTVDVGQCNATSVGCTAYSAEQINGSWVASPFVNTSLAMKLAGRSGSIFANKNIGASGACPVGSDGCSAFYPGKTTGDAVLGESVSYAKETAAGLVHLQKAPSYLGCYDTNPATPSTNWPTDVVSLQKVSAAAACDGYARVCIPEEVGCQAYYPDNGGPFVPGIVTAKNICDAGCVGYQTFSQRESFFEPAKGPLYFSATHGTSCQAQYTGCSEFTLLENEQLAYFSSIKRCEKPEGNNAKTFYTWEGSETSGYTIKSHTIAWLATTPQSYLDAGFSAAQVLGGPAYAEDTVSSLQESHDLCNAESYETLIELGIGTPGAASPDCRAFYDDTGAVYYRLETRTVTISDSCKPYRKTESFFVPDNGFSSETACVNKGGVWDNAAKSCLRCQGGGEYVENGNYCLYWAIAGEAGESASCPFEQNNCRGYLGNAGGNVADVFLVDTFEFGDKTGWTSGGLSIVAESTQVNGHSLKVADNAQAVREVPTNLLKTNTVYELTFWAKGVPEKINAHLNVNGVPLLFGDIEIRQNWQQFTLGPVAYTADIGSTQIVFNRLDGSGVYFLDNVRLRRVEDTVYKVKDSWKTVVTANGQSVIADAPLICDSNPLDNFPGTALGCEEYKDENDKTHTLTGFGSLCREEAIGCAPLYETYNTITGTSPEKAKAFKVRCDLSAKAAVETVCSLVTPATQGMLFNAEKALCSVAPGDDHCFVDEIIFAESKDLGDLVTALNPAIVDSSTVFVPADVATPIFLTVRPEYTCTESERGCVAVGLEHQTAPTTAAASFAHTTVTVKNNPDAYSGLNGTLCTGELVGCSSYSANQVVSYFKDPVLAGQKVCEYKKDVEDPLVGIKRSGWYLSGSDNTPCYPNAIESDGSFGIFSNKSVQYQGFVGLCPVSENACSELVDTADTSDIHPDGTSYFVKLTPDFFAEASLCDGQVSLKEGCALLNNPANPNKLYNTKDSYKKSETSGYETVAPVSNVQNDANLIVHVKRDRQCSEWLSCATSMTVFEKGLPPKEVCFDYTLCRELGPNGSCAKSVPVTESLAFLNDDRYVTRPVDWYAEEFTGYSLFNRYSLAHLSSVSFDDKNDATNDKRLAYQLPSAVIPANENICIPTAGKPFTNGLGCGFGLGGRCWQGQCLYPIEGEYPDSLNLAAVAGSPEEKNKKIADALQKSLVVPECKAHPESESPFAQSLALTSGGAKAKFNENATDNLTKSQSRYLFVSKNSKFTGANVCQNGECSCEYIKVGYNDGSKDFWPISTSQNLIPDGVCISADIATDIGAPCDKNADCGENGSCAPKKEQTTFIGQQNFCLEYDLSRKIGEETKNGVAQPLYACLTWLPLDISASSFDIYNTKLEAGYVPNADFDSLASAGQVFCTEGTARGRGQTDLPVKLPHPALVSNIWSTDDVTAASQENIGATVVASFKGKTDFDTYNNVYTLSKKMSDNLSPFAHEGGSFGTPIFDNKTGALEDSQESAAQCVSFSNSFAFDSPYVRYICSAATLKQNNKDYSVTDAGNALYSFVQTWSWKFLGMNASVLRVEMDSDSAPTNNSAGAFAKSFGFRQMPGKGDWHLKAQALLPYVVHNLKTFFHPPRFDSTPNATYSFDAEIGGLGSDKFTYVLATDEAVVNTDCLSPKSNANCNIQDDLILRTKAEEALMEDEVNNVHFLPLRFAGGRWGTNPRLMDKSITIPMSFLRADPKTAITGTVDSTSNKTVEFTVGAGTDKMNTWSYVLERDEKNSKCDGLLSFCDYDVDTSYTFTGNVTSKDTIQRRYMIVGYRSGANDSYPFLNELTNLATPPSDSKNDPLTAGCGENNFFALGMDFNKDGQFLGYISRWCHGHVDDNNSKNNGIQLAVVATLKDRCTEFASVHQTSENNEYNKAWTNRVWKNSQFALSNLGQSFPNILKGTEKSPFGSTGETDSGLKPNSLPLLSYIFRNTTWGIPLKCEGDAFGSHFGLSAVAKKDCEALKSAGYGDVADELSKNAGAGTVNSGLTLLKQLFARTYKRTVYPFAEVKTAGPNFDESQSVAKTLLPPQIYSVNPASCKISNNSGCTPGAKNNITVGGKTGELFDYNKDGLPDEDDNKNSIPSSIIAIGEYTANARFFAFADDNRMPIRRVLMDWGDDIITPDPETIAYHKNRKPLCEASDEAGSPSVGLCKKTGEPTPEPTPTGLPCKQKSDCPLDGTYDCVDPVGLAKLGVVKGFEDRDSYGSARFGNLPRACDPTFFQTAHTYVCTSQNATVAVSSLNSEDQTRIAAIKPGITSVCLFQPRVQVLDNWGWCNGVCNGKDGCYASETDVDQCNPLEAESTLNPWTTFKGQILIVPQ